MVAVYVRLNPDWLFCLVFIYLVVISSSISNTPQTDILFVTINNYN